MQFEFKIDIDLKPHQIKSVIDLERRESEHLFSCNEQDIMGIGPYLASMHITRSSTVVSEYLITKLVIEVSS